jgi:hypothetical protein
LPSEAEVDEPDDFEETTPRPPDADQPAHVMNILDLHRQKEMTSIPFRPPMLERMKVSRTGSMATVRLQRRAQLAEKLTEVFELPGIDEVRGGKDDLFTSLLLTNTCAHRNALLAPALSS